MRGIHTEYKWEIRLITLGMKCHTRNCRSKNFALSSGEGGFNYFVLNAVHFFGLECIRMVLTVPWTFEITLLTSWKADNRWAGKYILCFFWQQEIRSLSTLYPSWHLHNLLLLISTLVLFPILSIGISCGSSPWGFPTKILYEYAIAPRVLRCKSNSSYSFVMFSPCCFLSVLGPEWLLSCSEASFICVPL